MPNRALQLHPHNPAGQTAETWRHSLRIFPCRETGSRTGAPSRAERHCFKTCFQRLLCPLCKVTGTLLCLLYGVFITRDQGTPEANSSRGMFPLFSGGRAEQLHTLSESRRDHYVKHKVHVKLKKSRASAFRGRKRLQAGEINWSSISRYALQTAQG